MTVVHLESKWKGSGVVEMHPSEVCNSAVNRFILFPRFANRAAVKEGPVRRDIDTNPSLLRSGVFGVYMLSQGMSANESCVALVAADP